MLCEHNILLEQPENPPSTSGPNCLRSLPPSPGCLLPTRHPVRPKPSQATQTSQVSEPPYEGRPHHQALSEHPGTQHFLSRASLTYSHVEPPLHLTARRQDPSHHPRTAARITIQTLLQPSPVQQDFHFAVTPALQRCDAPHLHASATSDLPELAMPPILRDFPALAFETGSPLNVQAACMHFPTAEGPGQHSYPQPYAPFNDSQLPTALYRQPP